MRMSLFAFATALAVYVPSMKLSVMVVGPVEFNIWIASACAPVANHAPLKYFPLTTPAVISMASVGESRNVLSSTFTA